MNAENKCPGCAVLVEFGYSAEHAVAAHMFMLYKLRMSPSLTSHVPEAAGEGKIVDVGTADGYPPACDCGVGNLIGQHGGTHEPGCPARGE